LAGGGGTAFRGYLNGTTARRHDGTTARYSLFAGSEGVWQALLSDGDVL
jgi:hypothetical protein